MFNRKLFISNINKNCREQLPKIGYCLVLQNNDIYVFSFHENQKCFYYSVTSPENIQKKVLSDLTWNEAKQIYSYIKFSIEDELQNNIEKEKNSLLFKTRKFFNYLLK